MVMLVYFVPVVFSNFVVLMSPAIVRIAVDSEAIGVRIVSIRISISIRVTVRWVRISVWIWVGWRSNVNSEVYLCARLRRADEQE